MNVRLGRHVYGVAAIFFAILAVVWQDFNSWQQIHPLGAFAHREILLYFVAAVQLVGGVAVQLPKTARIGAAALGTMYLAFALLWVPFIVSHPRIYDSWGNFFEQFSLVSGALIVFAYGNGDRSSKPFVARLGYLGFGVCVVSFTLEQLFYLQGTAQFVPNWIPPGKMFWAVITTVAFALAALALLTGYLSLLAARMLTAMIVGFQFLVWLPAPFADPHKQINWVGNAQNLAIAGAAWMVADFLAQNRQVSQAFRRQEVAQELYTAK